MVNMLKKIILTAAAVISSGLLPSFAQRSDTLLETGWKFCKGDVAEAFAEQFDDSSWQNVTVPHDWAIPGLSGDK